MVHFRRREHQDLEYWGMTGLESSVGSGKEAETREAGKIQNFEIYPVLLRSPHSLLGRGVTRSYLHLRRKTGGCVNELLGQRDQR